MPNLHDSVTSCLRCDWLVAVIETSPCEECGKMVCPGCRLHIASDPNIFVCSPRCGAKQDLKAHREFQSMERAAQEAKWLRRKTERVQ